eukprot:1098852-Amphidinium_carterae.1
MKVFNKIGLLQDVVICKRMVGPAQHYFQVAPLTVMQVVDGMYQGLANTILIEASKHAWTRVAKLRVQSWHDRGDG